MGCCMGHGVGNGVGDRVWIVFGWLGIGRGRDGDNCVASGGVGWLGVGWGRVCDGWTQGHVSLRQQFSLVQHLLLQSSAASARRLRTPSPPNPKAASLLRPLPPLLMPPRRCHGKLDSQHLRRPAPQGGHPALPKAPQLSYARRGPHGLPALGGAARAPPARQVVCEHPCPHASLMPHASAAAMECNHPPAPAAPLQLAAREGQRASSFSPGATGCGQGGEEGIVEEGISHTTHALLVEEQCLKGDAKHVARGAWRVACCASRVARGAWRVACGVWRVACGVSRAA
mgnify:CR=1 FL=1